MCNNNNEFSTDCLVIHYLELWTFHLHNGLLYIYLSIAPGLDYELHL